MPSSSIILNDVDVPKKIITPATRPVIVKPKIECSLTKFFTIIIVNKKEQYCTQCCENVEQFIKDINSGIKISGLYYPPFELVYKKSFSNEKLAKQYVNTIKSYTRDKKMSLIKGVNNEH
jgi:predicted GIY-YIG superfamily endonuclease